MLENPHRQQELALPGCRNQGQPAGRVTYQDGMPRSHPGYFPTPPRKTSFSWPAAPETFVATRPGQSKRAREDDARSGGVCATGVIVAARWAAVAPKFSDQGSSFCWLRTLWWEADGQTSPTHK